MEAALIEHEALQSLGSENEAVTTAWSAEADQRYAAWQRGEMPDVDGPAAVDRIRRGLA